MYRYFYRNKRSGASVMSHRKLDRDELELIREMEVTTNAKTANITKEEMVVKPVVYRKPRVTKTKRKK